MDSETHLCQETWGPLPSDLGPGPGLGLRLVTAMRAACSLKHAVSQAS